MEFSLYKIIKTFVNAAAFKPFSVSVFVSLCLFLFLCWQKMWLLYWELGTMCVCHCVIIWMVKFLEHFPQHFLHIFVGYQLIFNIQLFHCKTFDVCILYSMISLMLRMNSHLLFCPVCNSHSLRVHATKKKVLQRHR